MCLRGSHGDDRLIKKLYWYDYQEIFLFRNRNSEIWCYFVASIFKKREIRDRFGALTVFSLQITAKTARRSVFLQASGRLGGPDLLRSDPARRITG